MRSTWIAAGLALLLGLLAGTASASSFITTLKADTIYQQSVIGAATNHHWADSTKILWTSAAKVMRLGFQVGYPHGSGVDTMAVFALTVRWHTCKGDTLVTGVCRDSAHTLVWKPSAQSVRTGAIADTLATFISYGSTAGSSTVQGGREIRVNVGTAHVAAEQGTSMSATVDLVDPSGIPFTAPYVSFKWRLIAGPALCQYRVWLLEERD